MIKLNAGDWVQIGGSEVWLCGCEFDANLNSASTPKCPICKVERPPKPEPVEDSPEGDWWERAKARIEALISRNHKLGGLSAQERIYAYGVAVEICEEERAKENGDSPTQAKQAVSRSEQVAAAWTATGVWTFEYTNATGSLRRTMMPGIFKNGTDSVLQFGSREVERILAMLNAEPVVEARQIAAEDGEPQSERPTLFSMVTELTEKFRKLEEHWNHIEHAPDDEIPQWALDAFDTDGDEDGDAQEQIDVLRRQIELLTLGSADHESRLLRLEAAHSETTSSADVLTGKAAGTTRCPICGRDQPHGDSCHRHDIPFRPEIDWARDAFEEAWRKSEIWNRPDVWAGDELDRNGPWGEYKNHQTNKSWHDFRIAWLLARGRSDVLDHDGAETAVSAPAEDVSDEEAPQVAAVPDSLLEKVRLGLVEIAEYIKNPSAYCDYHDTTADGMARYANELRNCVWQEQKRRPLLSTPETTVVYEGVVCGKGGATWVNLNLPDFKDGDRVRVTLIPSEGGEQ